MHALEHEGGTEGARNEFYPSSMMKSWGRFHDVVDVLPTMPLVDPGKTVNRLDWNHMLSLRLYICRPCPTNVQNTQKSARKRRTDLEDRRLLDCASDLVVDLREYIGGRMGRILRDVKPDCQDTG